MSNYVESSGLHLQIDDGLQVKPIRTKTETYIFLINQSKLIATIQNEYQTQGEHSITWNGTGNLSNKVGGGVYLYQVKAGDFVQTKKMMLMK